MSIRSIEKQSYANWELILIDDGSADRTVEIARSFVDPRIQVIADGLHKGLSRRLNEAILLSSGKYFARMDGDDVAYPERFDRQVRYLEEHSEVDLLGAGILVFKENGCALGTRTIWTKHEEICRRPLAGFYLPHPTWIGKAAWFREHLYRPEALRMEDQDLMLRTYRTSRFASMPEILVGYREDNFSLRKSMIARYHFVKLFASRFPGEESTRFFAVRGVAEHALKAMVEIFAVSTGQTYRILRHRALFVDAQELIRWRQVWNELAKSEHTTISPSLVHK